MGEHDASGAEMTPTLAETARRRADLHHALVELERATSRPAVSRLADWTEEVARRLGALVVTFDEHVAVTEREGGLYDEIVGRSPRLGQKTKELMAEHPEIRSTATDLLARLEGTPVGDAWPLAEARDDLQRLLGRLVRHRQLGSDLVWEAYNLDIGGLD